ncbi:CDP-diacylglycerol---serine O-phosphatidyltransferase [Chishuiella changwenlii]|jgi:CDP-diacylglycerol--serine O-phosphatidyltransferase|uniref:CDP-diacylglycerol---serine O-phosphatidyltransferase n=1 Tax=Chishuiella changwenlii TaxID=1434701 RepID=A0A1M6XFR9_9FLAO|nr:CDP-alcohol phosphatidyltransferase family protein [Chishuiella changwenlii]GGF00694.1 CDP-diacylglycerol--serine O-phosphatidyltransferase [Chishuiella changwenlii]SHL04758.1 CDP-diacylglycerol---serine O-phosphatidyltransferase [Chishuiella changwenlii]
MKLITIPNLLTLLNLSCGVLSSIFIISSNGEITTTTVTIVMVLMIISLVADFLDGMVARLMKIGSPIGKELDSLADCISFGVVPGLMLFSMFNHLSVDFIYENPNLKIAAISLFAFLVPAFSALRLAKFNLDEDQATYFKGLATPSNTLFIFSVFSIYYNNGKIINTEIDPYLLILISIVFSILLIIDLPLFALKFKGLSWAENYYKFIFLIITIGLLICLQIVAIPIIIVLYIMTSIIFRKEITK